MSLSDDARHLFDVGLAAANPGPAVTAALQAQPVSPQTGGALHIIALGKAAIPMVRAALAQTGDVAQTLVVTNPENTAEVAGAQVFAAAHPVPDAVGLAAGQAVMDLIDPLGPQDHLLVLISGGGSALLPAPAPGLTLADKAAVNALLLASGAPIEDMNLIRQSLSQLKGGGLARRAAPAQVTALILSDVVGDDLSAVASGPTVAPIGTPTQAIKTLKARSLWAELPQAVQTHLQTAKPAAPLPPVDNRLIGGNGKSVTAMANAAPHAQAAATPLDGLAEQAAGQILATAKAPGTYLWGGETTVILKGAGKGGRNQHLALKFALLAEAANWTTDWAFLSGGTDGRDGPTDAAGALVTPETLHKIRAKGIDPQAALDTNDSYHALAAANDLLITGGTGTNVADLQILIRR